MPHNGNAVVLLIALFSASLIAIVGGCGSGKPEFDSTDRLANEEIPPEFLGENAVILLEEDGMEITGNYAVHEYKVVKKILEAGHPEEATFSFSTDKHRKIVSIKGRAIHPDGREKILSKNDISIVPDFKQFVLYSDNTSHTFRFPGEKAGAVLEVAVRWKIDNLFYWEPVVFQRDIPIVTRKYTLVHPKDFDFATQGVAMSDTPDKTSDLSGGRTELVWERHNIDKFEEEDMMPPAIEYVPSLWFSAHEDLELGVPLRLNSWKGVVEWYQGLSASSLEAGSGVKALTRTLCASGTSEEERARRIFHWVQGNLRYVAIYLGLDGYRPHDAEQTLRNRYGDCKDQAVVLASSLRVAGIEAYPVTVRTADLGRLPDKLPSPGYFNHLIVAAVISGETVYLDPTCESCSFGVLPYDDQGAEALVIRDGENKLRTLPVNSPRVNRWNVVMNASIDESGDAEIAGTIECDGYHAASMRRRFAYRGGKSEREIAAELFSRRIVGARVDDVNIEGGEPQADTLTIAIKWTIPRWLDTNRNVCFFNAMLYPVQLNVPSCDNRKYPVVLGKGSTSRYDISISFPQGWIPAGLPEAIDVTSEQFDYSCTWSRQAQNVRYSRVWSLKNPTVSTTECADVMDRFQTVLSREKAMIAVGRQ